MAKNDNLKDFLTDVADAIREKKGTEEKINPQNFSDEIRNLPSGSAPRWTGHADVEGLKAIGWDDDDIAYYQQHGVNWNEEDDEYHKVSDDNKALYGVLTANNISTYKERIVYLPKIDTSSVTNMDMMFYECHLLVAIPYLDTHNVTSMYATFGECWSLITIPLINIDKVTDVLGMFFNCYSLTSIPNFDFKNVLSVSQMFNACFSLRSCPEMNLMEGCGVETLFMECHSLDTISYIRLLNTRAGSVFRGNFALKNIKLVTNVAVGFGNAAALTKDSLLFMINNEVATEPITITLNTYAYERLVEDVDVVAALANHPNVSLAK